MMMTIIGILTGAALGTRYRVLSLVPVTVAGSVVLVALDHVNEVPLGSTVLTALTLTVGLQVGYLVGVAVRSALPVRLTDRVGAQRRRAQMASAVIPTSNR